jgi:crotonobetainyl-CoA:carnitine CoA-transferase CaiB-like acyl-CoA transferase
MGALMSVTGLPGQGPVRVGIPIADLCGGIFAAYGVTVALLEREQSGKGQWLHTSLLEAMLYMMDFQAARWTLDHEIPGQAGNSHPTSIPTGVFKTSDGHINIAVFGGKIWERFAEALDSLEWISDERSKTKSARSINRDWLNAEIEQRLQQHSSDYWIEKLNAAGVACGRINNLKQAFEEPQVQHLQMLKKVTSERLGEQLLMGQPVTLTRTPFTIARATPRRGEHSEEIFLEVGYTREDLVRMKATGVF